MTAAERVSDIQVPMRDGVLLSANVWVPDGAGPWPTVLLRTPYGNNVAEFERYGLPAYVAAGYAVVFQSVRGCGRSQGTFVFMFGEGADGYDSIEWIASQPWCDGRVAMDGGSYLGTVQWLAARERPPHLKCIMPAVSAGDWFNELPFNGGALHADWALSWLSGIAGVEFDFEKSGDQNLQRFRPLADAGRVLGVDLPILREVFEHQTLDDYWRRLFFTPQDYARIDIPALTVTGWFDGDQPGALRYWREREQHAPRTADRLVIGPWQHQECYLGGIAKLRELDFGEQSVLPIQALRLAFLEAHLKGTATLESPRVRTFITGENRWREDDRYPPASSRTMEWFLASGGNANTLDGDGRLDRSAASGSPDHFTYDPLRPVVYKPSCADHREIERRDDVLVYSSPALEQPLTVLGLVEVVLHVASSAPDTDFTAKLLDVLPDGRAISLTHTGGVMRARHREGFDRMVPLTPGKQAVLRIRLSHVGHTFLPGHRLRLEISSSCFPLAEPNANTGLDPATDTSHQSARQTVFHTPASPSRLLLPVLP